MKCDSDKAKTGVLILSAAPAPAEMTGLFGEVPSGLVAVNGKPALSWIIDELLSQGFVNFYINVGYKKELVTQLIKGKYEALCNIKLLEGDYKKPPGVAIVEALSNIDSTDLLVVLGDTIFSEKIDLDESFVAVSEDYSYPEKWCLTSSDYEETLGTLIDKENVQFPQDYKALVGLYYFKNLDLIKKDELLSKKSDLQISDVLGRYSEQDAIVVKKCDNWIDLGHLDRYQQAKFQMLGSRFFNRIEFDSLLGTITKYSSNKEKFRNEISWYLEMPQELKVLSPRVLNFDLGEDPYLTMDFYGYPSLAELFLYSSVHVRHWHQIFLKLGKTVELFRRYDGRVDESEYHKIYYKKTESRLAELEGSNTFFGKVLQMDQVEINGEVFTNYPVLREAVEARVSELYRNSETQNCFIHGDFCFSNILYDLGSGVLRTIDPRGKWANTMYGDIRYDVAKLRHSAHGFYDFIVNDFFGVETNDEGSFKFDIYANELHFKAANMFDKVVTSSWSIRDIEFIESLLFLSMTPLHKENFNRQIAMYCQGIRLLNSSMKDWKAKT